MDTNKYSILVLSRNYSNGLSVARSLGSVGFVVDMIASSHKEGASDIAACSKYIRNYSEVVSKKMGNEGELELIEEILKHVNSDNTVILIPTDDYTTTVVDNNRDKLEEHFLMPHIKNQHNGDLVKLMDKTVQAELAGALGLNVAASWKFDLWQEVIVPDDVIYPCFVKPIRSTEGYKTEMSVCSSKDELEGKLIEMKDAYENRTILVQEFLNIDYEIASAGVCLDEHIVLPGLIKKTSKGKHVTGVTLTGQLCSNDLIDKKVYTQAIELLRKFHYTGMFGMEFAVCGDKVYFNEVNLRSAGEAFAYLCCGVNLAEIYVKGLLNETIEQEEEVLKETDRSFIYDKVAWEDYVYDNITKEELDSYINSVDFSILINEDDPEPGNLFLKENLEKRERREKNKALREECIQAIVDACGVSRDEAIIQLDDARERLGIKYKHYLRTQMWEIPVEDQAAKYEKYLLSREYKHLLVKENEHLVVVFSRNYATALSVARSLGAEGFVVDLVASVNKTGNSEISAVSKYIRNNVEITCGKSNKYGKKQLVKELQNYRALDNKPLLFPIDDYTAAVADEYKDLLKDIFMMPNIDGGSGSIIEHMDKTVQERLAREGGMNVPRSWIFDLNNRIEIPEDMVYPCFCKPLESFSGSKSDIAKCNSYNELVIHLGNLQAKESKRSIMVQEFLNIDDEIDFSGLCLGEKVIIPAIIRKTRVAQFEKGVTLAGRVHPFEEIDEATRKQIVATLKKYHYFGMFDMELNIVGDKIYFNEVNLRSGGPNYAYFMSGVNLPAIFAKEAFGLGHSEDEEKVKEYGKTFVYDKIAWEDYAHRYINKKQLKNLLNKSDFLLLDNKDDPEPGKLFFKTKASKSDTIRRKTLVRSLRLASRPILGPAKRKLLGYPQTKKKNDRAYDGEKPRVMIVGRNYSSNLSMAKSLGEAGYPVEVVRVQQVLARFTNMLYNLKPEAYSKYVNAYYICVTNRNPQILVDRLLKLADKNKKMVIIPTDDLTADVVDENMNVLKKYYYMPDIDNTPGKISQMMDKGYQKQLAKDYGLPVVNSTVIKTYKGEYTIPETITYPCFIKPNMSKNASKSKIKKCNDKEELIATLNEFSRKRDIEMIVEDYIEIAREYSLLGLSTRDGVIGPGFFVAEEGGKEEHRGVALKGRILNVDDYRELIDQLNGFVETLNFNGLFDIDLIETTSGEMYFVEINMRYGASGYAVTRCGANLPAMFVDFVYYGKPIDKSCKIEGGKTFVSEKVVIDEYRMDRISWDDVKNAMSSADIYFVKDNDDKKPYRHFKKRYIEARRLRNIDRKTINQEDDDD